jgi:hypothetical protein
MKAETSSGQPSTLAEQAVGIARCQVVPAGDVGRDEAAEALAVSLVEGLDVGARYVAGFELGLARIGGKILPPGVGPGVALTAPTS